MSFGYRYRGVDARASCILILQRRYASLAAIGRLLAMQYSNNRLIRQNNLT